MNDHPSPLGPAKMPGLFFLDGSLKGKTLSTRAEQALIGSRSHCELRCPEQGDAPVAEEEAILEERDGEWWIKTVSGNGLEVGERCVEEHRLREGDLVQLGREGPTFRFQLLPAGPRPTKSFRQVVEDSRAVARRTHTRSGARRMTTMARAVLVEGLVNGTRRLRMLVVALLVAVVGLGVGLGWAMTVMIRADELTREEIDDQQRAWERERAQGERLARREAEERKRLEAVIARLEERGERQDFRLAKLRYQQMHAARMNAAVVKPSSLYERYAGSVCLIAVQWKYYNPKRQVWAKGARGPITEFITGTGFLVSVDGHVLTNRHVLDPWWENAEAKVLLSLGYRPVRQATLAYFPGQRQSIPLDRLATHEKVDVGLGRLREVPEGLRPCPLAEERAPEPRPGEELVLPGYPRGINGLRVKLTREQEENLDRSPPQTARDFIDRLARLGAIQPHLNRGIVSTVNEEVLSYDAQTTSGASGSPLFNARGEVIGINAAVSVGFTGANIGPPIVFARDLLARFREAPPTPNPEEHVPAP